MGHYSKGRPVYLDLLRIKLPVTGVVSIAHRVTGVLLTLLTPVLIYLLAQSVRSPAGFADTLAFFDHVLVKLVLLLVVWLVAHHLFAGIRYLLIDIDWGVERLTARRTAWVVHALSVLAVVIAIGVIF